MNFFFTSDTVGSLLAEGLYGTTLVTSLLCTTAENISPLASTEQTLLVQFLSMMAIVLY